MPTPVEILRTVLHPAVRLPASGGQLRIEEHQVGAAYPRFKLGVNLNHAAVGLEKLQRKQNTDLALPWFDPQQPGFCSKCDAIVFCDVPDNILLVVCVELKSGNPGDALTQLKSGRAVARFIVELLEVHQRVKPKPKYVGVIVTARKIPKRGKTGPERLRFSERNGMSVAEWDHSYPLQLSQIAAAA